MYTASKKPRCPEFLAFARTLNLFAGLAQTAFLHSCVVLRCRVMPLSDLVVTSGAGRASSSSLLQVSLVLVFFRRPDRGRSTLALVLVPMPVPTFFFFFFVFAFLLFLDWAPAPRSCPSILLGPASTLSAVSVLLFVLSLSSGHLALANKLAGTCCFILSSSRCVVLPTYLCPHAQLYK